MTVSLFPVVGLAMWMGVARSKGAPEALSGVVAGRVDFYFSPIFAALLLIQAGRLSALAVTGSRRSPQLRQTPTFAEAGIPEVDDNFWIGLFVPARTPRSIIDRLHDATVRSVQSSAVMEKLEKLGAQTMTATPEQFDALVKQQISDNAVIIKEAGISQD
jgi:tripartite-type tricarboxylate transporter receptor subunit TctC